MSISALLIEKVVHLISLGGYPSIIFLMALESMIVPLPSEAVMPFAGFLISEGKMTFALLALASTLGSVIGSLLSYYMGKYGGNTFLKHFGKYIFLNENHLIQTEQFFKKHGKKTVFIGRFIPVVRHFISIPAGIARMNMSTFLFYTILGAGIWNTFLAYVGFVLKNNWHTLEQYTKVLDIIVVLAILSVIIYLFLKKRPTHT
jgi:membrane protein DedA with SNARE-associated domain